MRKLVHEEIDREISDKAVHLAYRFAGKPTAKAFLKALSVFPGMPVKAAGRKVIHDIGQKIHPTEGKQSVKTLIRQGQGVSSIPLSDEGMKDFQKIARKYGVDFAYENAEGNIEIKPVDEWLDDVYLRLDKEQAITLMEDIYDNGATLFQFYTDREN